MPLSPSFLRAGWGAVMLQCAVFSLTPLPAEAMLPGQCAIFARPPFPSGAMAPEEKSLTSKAIPLLPSVKAFLGANPTHDQEVDGAEFSALFAKYDGRSLLTRELFTDYQAAKAAGIQVFTPGDLFDYVMINRTLHAPPTKDDFDLLRKKLR